MGGGCALELACNSLGSAELLKSIRRVAGSDLCFRRIMFVDFGLENNHQGRHSGDLWGQTEEHMREELTGSMVDRIWVLRERQDKCNDSLYVSACTVINNSGSESNSQRMVSSIWNVLFWKLSTDYLLMRVKRRVKELPCNSTLKKTNGTWSSWKIEREKVEAVTDFIFLGSKINVDGEYSHNIKRSLLLERIAMSNLVSI